jgi:2,3,4,5-tetrahydropyridine-2-carboxylate N-succinyltransferase
MRTDPAWGIGLATMTAQRQVLDTWYPTGRLGLGPLPDGGPTAQLDLPPTAIGERALPGLRTEVVTSEIGSLADPIKDTA